MLRKVRDDYTIRAQVTEGLVLATPVKVSVAETYAASRSLPADLQGAGLDDAVDGKYVSSIEITDGTILIHYGNAAHSKISGHTLSLHPVDVDNGVEWSCGYAAGSEATQTDIEPKYLPSACRRIERL